MNKIMLLWRAVLLDAVLQGDLLALRSAHLEACVLDEPGIRRAQCCAPPDDSSSRAHVLGQGLGQLPGSFQV